jgi:hypothetical protein
MKIAVAQSSAGSARSAIREIVDDILAGGRPAPDFLAIHFGVGCEGVALASAARAAFGTMALHGGSSCLGVMTYDGVVIGDGASVGGFAIWDAHGSYGTASADLGLDAFDAARRAAEAALVAAGRPYEIPDMVWLTVAPGREEQVIDGIRSIVGPGTLIVGGSAADNDVGGRWCQFGPHHSHGDGVVVSALFSSVPIASTYQSGYAPTGDAGLVTRAKGRRLFEIDGQPAAEVYHRWTGGAIPMAEVKPVSVLAAATLWPLGRVTRRIAGVPFHLLAHPAMSNPDGSLDMFADAAEGDQLWQMRGSADSLVSRAGRIARQAHDDIGGVVAGALVVYCGGCMLAVQDRMAEVQAGIAEALGDAPWLGIFTFGEQGVPAGEEPMHGNLMISCTAFGR